MTLTVGSFIVVQSGQNEWSVLELNAPYSRVVGKFKSRELADKECDKRRATLEEPETLKFPEPLTERQTQGMLAYLEESARLQTLSNVELVSECAGSRPADYAVVEEMMSRLDPEWSKRDD